MKTPGAYKEMEFVDILVTLAKLLQPKIYVELGTKRGYTINQMALVCQRAIGVDPVGLAPTRPNIIPIKSTSLEYAATLKGQGEMIDFLFIDADHRKEAVLADFDAFFPYVRSGTGLIFLHDTHPVNESLLSDGYCSNAWEAAEFLLDNLINDTRSVTGTYYKYELVTIPGPWAGLTIIRKLGKYHLAWATKDMNHIPVDDAVPDPDPDTEHKPMVYGGDNCQFPDTELVPEPDTAHKPIQSPEYNPTRPPQNKKPVPPLWKQKLKDRKK